MCPTAVSKKVLHIASEYIGPSSYMFLQRQTYAHMCGLNFDDIESEHLPELSKWIRISASLILDKEKAEEFAERIRNVK